MIRAYYGLLVARSAKDVADQAVRTAESNVQRVQDRLRAGLVVDSDLLAAQVELSNLKRQQIQAQGDIVTAEAALNTWMGQPVDVSPQISGTLTEKTFQIENQEVLIQRAIEHRPDYAAFHRRLSALPKIASARPGRTFFRTLERLRALESAAET